MVQATVIFVHKSVILRRNMLREYKNIENILDFGKVIIIVVVTITSPKTILHFSGCYVVCSMQKPDKLCTPGGNCHRKQQ